MNKFYKLENLRKEHKYTYKDMAIFLGLSKTYYWQLENKKRKLYYQMAKRIADIFNLKPDDIFYEV